MKPMISQKFGGPWTEKKLEAVEKYLVAYMRIMRGEKVGGIFNVTYVDGFAGSGRRYSEAGGLFEDNDSEIAEFYRGSVHRSLTTEKPFDNYLFIESKSKYVEELRSTINDFPDMAGLVEIKQGDANVEIQSWCKKLKSKDRALVSLDPYGMQVQWSTLNALAETKKVDVWLLVPIGQAIARLLTKGHPPDEWGNALTRFFGEDAWKSEFWITDKIPTLLGEEDQLKRDVNYEKITNYMVRRLKSIFYGVLEEPIILRNSQGIPLYVLCFAASNKNGSAPALRIASSIAKRINDGN